MCSRWQEIMFIWNCKLTSTFKLYVYFLFPLIVPLVVPDYGRPESIQAETEWEYTLR